MSVRSTPVNLNYGSTSRSETPLSNLSSSIQVPNPQPEVAETQILVINAEQPEHRALLQPEDNTLKDKAKWALKQIAKVGIYGGLACSSVSSALGWYAWWYGEDADASTALEVGKYMAGGLAIALTIVGGAATTINNKLTKEREPAQDKCLAAKAGSKTSAAMVMTVATLVIGDAISLGIDPSIRTVRGCLMLALGNAGAAIATLGYIDPSIATLTSSIDNMIEGGSLALTNSPRDLGGDVFAGLVSGCASGFIGGAFVEKHGKMKCGNTKSTVWFFVRGATMELFRSALVAGLAAGIITDYKAFGVKAAVNIVTGGIVTSLQGPTLNLQNWAFEKAQQHEDDGRLCHAVLHRYAGTTPLNFVCNSLFQVGLPITEEQLHHAILNAIDKKL